MADETKKTDGRRSVTYAAWLAEGAALFGDDRSVWRFKCPACGYLQTVADYDAAGLPRSAAAFSCIGRGRVERRKAFGGVGPGPCDYAGGGLFAINPVEVVFSDGGKLSAFEFAPY